MSRRSLLVTLAGLLVIALGLAALSYVLVRHEPSWYVEANIPPGKERRTQSQNFLSEFMGFKTSINNDTKWSQQFSQKQINSFFEENFIQQGLDHFLLPDGISQPRVGIEPNYLRIGFRYGAGAWSTIVTADLRIWLPVGEPNALACELVGLHAGLLPVKVLSLFDRIAQAARDNGIEVTWYRHSGHPVAVIRFQADQPRVTMQLEYFALADGAISIVGCSPEGSPARASMPAVEPTAAATPSAAAAPIRSN